MHTPETDFSDIERHILQHGSKFPAPITRPDGLSPTGKPAARPQIQELLPENPRVRNFVVALHRALERRLG